MTEQRVLFLNRAWDDLKAHDYSDADIAFVVAESWENKKLIEGQHRIPHKRFSDHYDIYADFRIEDHVREDGSPTQYKAFYFTWSD